MEHALEIKKNDHWIRIAIRKSRLALIDLAFELNNYECKIVEVR